MSNDISDVLRARIEQSGESHNSLGRRADVDPAVLNRFVRGERDIRLAVANRLAAALGLQLTVRPKGQKR